MKECFIKLKELRLEKNYNYEQMAQLLGISQGFYWQIENKKRRLYYDMAKKIADIFDLKPDDIFYE